MKKFLSIILSAAMVLTLTAGLNFSVFADTYDNFTYTVADGRATVTGCVNSDVTSLIIPETIGNDAVTVTNIGKSAFSDYSNLTSVTLPATIKAVADRAFYGCSGLTKTYYKGTADQWVNIEFGFSANPVTFSHNLYINNKPVSEIALSETQKIGSYAFCGLTSLKSITIPESVKSIGGSAFKDCTSLTKTNYTGTVDQWAQIDFKSNPVEFSKNLYIDNEVLTEAEISVSQISANAFIKCHTLKNITLSDNVESIGDKAFYNCAFSDITIPNSVTAIGDSAFDECFSLKSVIVPKSVTKIGDDAFNDVETAYYTGSKSDFSELSIGSGSDCLSTDRINYVTDDGIAHTVSDNDEAVITGYFGTNENIVIPSEIDGSAVTQIGTKAFYDNNLITSVTLPNTINSIGYMSFEGCDNLVKLDMQEGVTDIGNFAFYHCSKLTDLTIPSTVASIGSYAFSGCTSLKNVTYNGTKESWNNISIGEDGTGLSEAVISCTNGKINSTDSEPTTDTTDPSTSTDPTEAQPTTSNQPTNSDDQTTPTKSDTGNSSESPSSNDDGNSSTTTAPSSSSTQNNGNSTNNTYYNNYVTNFILSPSDTASNSTSVKKPKSTSIKKLTKGKKKITVQWKKVSGVKGYQVQVATDKKFKKNKKTVTIKKQKTTKTTVKKLKSKKKYYVRVRTYKVVNGKKIYSKWSKVKTVKTK